MYFLSIQSNLEICKVNRSLTRGQQQPQQPQQPQSLGSFSFPARVLPSIMCSGRAGNESTARAHNYNSPTLFFSLPPQRHIANLLFSPPSAPGKNPHLFGVGLSCMLASYPLTFLAMLRRLGPMSSRGRWRPDQYS